MLFSSNYSIKSIVDAQKCSSVQLDSHHTEHTSLSTTLLGGLIQLCQSQETAFKLW